MASENNTGVATALWNLYLTSENTDFTFFIHCGETVVAIHAHLLVISMWSPVFADMSACNSIDVHDVRPTVLKAILNFMYGSSEEIKDSTDEEFLRDVYVAAAEYKIKELKRICRNNLNNFVTVKLENVFELLNAAMSTKSEGLKQRCVKVLEAKTAEVLKSCDIQNITPFMINTLIELENISLPSEYDLLVWVYDWAECEYNKLSQENYSQYANLHLAIMHPFLPYLNFTSLTAEQFGALVNEHEHFFDQRDSYRIFMNISCPGTVVEMPFWYNKNRKPRFYKKVALKSTVELIENSEEDDVLLVSENLTVSESVCNSDIAEMEENVIVNESAELTRQSDVSNSITTTSNIYNSFIVEECSDSPWNSLKEPSICRKKIKKKKIKKSYLLPGGKRNGGTSWNDYNQCSWKTKYSSGDFESLISTVWKQQRYGSAGA